MKTLYLRNLLTKYLILVTSFSYAHATADELAYTRDTVVDYFNSSSDIYIAMKVGGRITYNEYKEYLLGELEEDELYETWKSIKFGEKEKFLILEKHKGSDKVGSIISAVYLSDYGVTRIGGKYLLFFHRNDKSDNLEFGKCDVVGLDSIPDPTRENIEQMILYVGKSTLTPCLYHVKYDQE